MLPEIDTCFNIQRYKILVARKDLMVKEITQVMDSEFKPSHNCYLILYEGSYKGTWGPFSSLVAQVLDSMLLHHLVGKPFIALNQINTTIDSFEKHTHSGILQIAKSVINLALLDLIGFKNNRPIWQLYKSKPSIDKLPKAYASYLSYPFKQDIRVIKQYVEHKPFSHIKVSPLAFPHMLHNIELKTAIDFKTFFDNKYVPQLLENENHIAWLEEPCLPWEKNKLTKILELKLPLAYGENCYNVGDFEMVEPICKVWQPDILSSGSFDGFIKFLNLGLKSNKLLTPHGGSIIPTLHALNIGVKVESIEWHLLLEPFRLRLWEDSAHLLSGKDKFILDQPGWSGNKLVKWLEKTI